MNIFTPMTATEKFLLLMLLVNSIESKLFFVEINDNIYPAILRDDMDEFNENIRRIEKLKLGDSDKFLFISQLNKYITRTIKINNFTFELNIFMNIPCDKEIKPFFNESEIIKIK